jgi:transcriptional regulatory protein LevR
MTFPILYAESNRAGGMKGGHLDHSGDSQPIPIAERLRFLAEADVITGTARDLTTESVDRIAARLRAPLDPEAAAPLVTHIAMALSRVERGEQEAALPAVVEAEVADLLEMRRFAEALAERWSEVLDRPIPESEILYVVAHLATLEAMAR